MKTTMIRLGFLIIALHLPLVSFCLFPKSNLYKKILPDTTLTQEKKEQLLLVDAEERNKYMYQPFIDLAGSLKIKVHYITISEIVDTPKQNNHLLDYRYAFFILNRSLISTLNHSKASNKILSVIRSCIQLPGITIGLLFDREIQTLEKHKKILVSLFKKIGLNKIFSKKNNIINSIIETYLEVPLEARCTWYHRALGQPRMPLLFSQQLAKKQITDSTKWDTKDCKLLPINKEGLKKASPLFPLWLHWHNYEKNNNIVFGSATPLSFSSINENFHICPVDFNIRTLLNTVLYQSLHEIKLLAHSTNQLSIEQIKKKRRPPFPTACSLKPHLLATTKKKKLSKKIAWMEIDIFKPLSEEEKKDKNIVRKKEIKQKKLIAYILNSGLDNLWISFAPNMYYSPFGKKKRARKKFLTTIGSFTRSLTEEARNKKTPLPAILVGCEISNNLEVKNPFTSAQDLFGISYKRCPRPLSNDFWDKEVIKPLSKFVHDWKRPTVGSGIPLGGIVLDLEMYFAKPGMFSSTMGFEHQTAQNFGPLKKHTGHYPLSAHTISSWLIKNSQMAAYFSYLEKSAEKLGTYLSDHSEKIIPNGTISCYAPNIPISWFYKGFLKGLCKGNKEILLMTFNTSFAQHKQWLSDQGIYAQHAGVLMLSKLHDIPTCKHWCDHICTYHDGIWLNRFSRFVETYKKNQWCTIEQTSLDEKGKEFCMKYLNTK